MKLLNRDPKKRLGSGPGEAEDIKIHKFFKGIDWDQVYNRKLTPPKPYIPQIVETNVEFDVFKDSALDKETDDKMNQWTFISADFK